jgi:hypothetical protein
MLTFGVHSVTLVSYDTITICFITFGIKAYDPWVWFFQMSHICIFAINFYWRSFK